MTELLTAASTTGPSAATDWSGGRGTFSVVGTFDGATVQLEHSPDGGDTWVSVGSDTVLTAAGMGNFGVNAGQVRANVTISGTTQSVTAKIF